MPLAAVHGEGNLLHLQLTSDSGHPNLFTAKTGDPQWRLVRKGVAPAFNPQNIRFVSHAQPTAQFSGLPAADVD